MESQISRRRVNGVTVSWLSCQTQTVRCDKTHRVPKLIDSVSFVSRTYLGSWSWGGVTTSLRTTTTWYSDKDNTRVIEHELFRHRPYLTSYGAVSHVMMYSIMLGEITPYLQKQCTCILIVTSWTFHWVHTERKLKNPFCCDLDHSFNILTTCRWIGYNAKMPRNTKFVETRHLGTRPRVEGNVGSWNGFVLTQAQLDGVFAPRWNQKDA